MKLTSCFTDRKTELKSVFGVLLVLVLSSNEIAVAEPLTYSPDQWPRHWNVLMSGTSHQQRLNKNIPNADYSRRVPVRSPQWGYAPRVKQKPRRSRTPEYNTNFHLMNYSNQVNRYAGLYRRNNYQPVANMGLANPYPAPYLGYFSSALLAPGVAAPAVPFTTNTFGIYPYSNTPYSSLYAVPGAVPGMGMPW